MNPLILAALACSMMQSPDDQATCRAIEANNAAMCQAVKSEAKRTQCRVKLGDNTSNCNVLNTNDREQCRMLAAIRQPNH
jgi:hypothetical protein